MRGGSSGLSLSQNPDNTVKKQGDRQVNQLPNNESSGTECRSEHGPGGASAVAAWQNSCADDQRGCAGFNCLNIDHAGQSGELGEQLHRCLDRESVLARHADDINPFPYP